MARIRSIKPDFFRHEGLFEAERESGLPLRVAFAGLWTVADREGRFRWRPRQLALDVLPFDEVDFAVVLETLRAAGFIVRYGEAGQEYGAIPSWGRHQVINNRETASTLPSPGLDACGMRGPRVEHASGTPLVHAPGEGKGMEEEEEEEGNLAVASQPRHRPGAGDPAAGLVPCPYAMIVKLYHEHLPTLPSVKLMSIGRQRAIRKLWGWTLHSSKPNGERRASTATEALAWFGSFFARAAENDFLMGRTERAGRHAGWRCDLDFLLTDKGMQHVIEKTEAAA